jgi:hypothetical protein
MAIARRRLKIRFIDVSPTVLICVVAFTLELFHIRIIRDLPMRRKLGSAWRIAITRMRRRAAN